MDDSPRRMNAKELAARAQLVVEQLRAEGKNLSPVIGKSKALVEHFWAKEWIKHLAQSEAYGMRLAPGRSYLRNGCVIDLAISRGHISALVSGEYVYEVDIRMDTPDEEQLARIKEACASSVASWVDLMQGKLSDDLLSILCREDMGILPELANMKCSCTCNDWADVCKHTAAALYAAGIKIDQEPELLFLLRDITPEQIMPGKEHVSQQEADPLSKGDLSSLFGIDLEL